MSVLVDQCIIALFCRSISINSASDHHSLDQPFRVVAEGINVYSSYVVSAVSIVSQSRELTVANTLEAPNTTPACA